MKNFLWSGVGETSRDYLFHWDVCCLSRADGDLGIGNLISKNVFLLAKCALAFL